MEQVSYFDMVYHRLMQDYGKTSLQDYPCVEGIVTNLVNSQYDVERQEDVSDIIRLMALKYYLYFFDQDEDYINSLILYHEPEEFVAIALEDTAILSTLVQNEIKCYSEEEPFPYELLDSFVTSQLDSDWYQTGLDLYRAYHPFYEQENKAYAHWKRNRNVQAKMMETSIDHFLSFYLFGKNYLEKEGSLFETVQILSDKLEDLAGNNYPLYEKCAIDLLTTYYTIYKYRLLAHSPINEVRSKLVLDMEMMSKDNLLSLVRYDEDTRKLLFEGVLKDYDIVEYSQMENKIEPYTHTFVKKFQ